MHLLTNLVSGDFVKVRADHSDRTRAGKDGMVMAVDGEEVVLYFEHDRANRDQRAFCAGPEQWEMSELDLATVDRDTLVARPGSSGHRAGDVARLH